MNTTTTTAEQIAARYSNDGTVWVRETNTTDDPQVLALAEALGYDGRVDIALECRAIGGTFTQHLLGGGHATHRYTFADGSAITFAGGAWDLGYAGCYCWEGVGHTDACTAGGGR